MIGGAAEMCTGERAVVLLFILRILISVPLSLFFEAGALCLLALAALFLEFSADSPSSPLLRRFKTRPGASSGLLLGTITFPAVTLSRLIQHSRELRGDLVGIEEMANLSSQYWAASASCFGVVIFFYLVLYWSFQSTQTPVHALLYIALYGAACYLSLVTVVDSGWIVAVKLMWLVCHSLAAVMLIQYILHTFPSCASIGEALLISCGVVVYSVNALAHTLSKISMTLLSSEVNFVGFGPQSELATVIQGVMLGLLLLPVLYKSSLHVWNFLRSCKKDGTAGTCGKIESSILFYFSLVLMLTILVPAWLHFVQDFHVHPVKWVFMFVFFEPFGRLSLCLYWILVILASVFRFYNISKHSKIERILLRKYYHLVAVLMFSPAILFQPAFLDLAYSAALAVFLVLEIIRIWKIRPLGDKIHLFMNAFTDHRDSEILIISHFSLLLGCALPKWLSSGFNDRPLAPFAGILSLGIGDTMASVVGHKYGVIRWSKTGKKTLEGTAAGITSVLAACLLLVPLITSTGFVLSKHWLSLTVAVTISGLLEAYTAQLDNAFIPLVFYSLLCL